MPHNRSPSKLPESWRLICEGNVWRESNVAGKLVNKRWMQLFGSGAGGGAGPAEPPVLASFRHQKDSEPSKVWEITRNCSISDIGKGAFHLRSETSTLVAVVAGRYEEREMVRHGACVVVRERVRPQTRRACAWGGESPCSLVRVGAPLWL